MAQFLDFLKTNIRFLFEKIVYLFVREKEQVIQN